MEQDISVCSALVHRHAVRAHHRLRWSGEVCGRISSLQCGYRDLRLKGKSKRAARWRIPPDPGIEVSSVVYFWFH
jgi:hypothetical protein